MAKLTIVRQTHMNRRFFENLKDDISLEMVLISGGSFEMGAAENELEKSEDELPQHLVTVPTFFMGRYPVTQAQWRVVAALPQEEIVLKADPSHFKGNDRPVEGINWHEAVEFCERLSRETDKNYRLPSEAEWEYACRAGTRTPFHFGETITTDLANYDGTYSYGKGTKGEYTTPVGQFGVANNFGLCELHGNVYEWCADAWHSNYESAPVDGSVWKEGGDDSYRVIRGGSWSSNPLHCRSAYRHCRPPDPRPNNIGFRVVCAVRGSV